LINRGIEVYAIEHHTSLIPRPGLNIIRGRISSIDRKLIKTLKPDMVFHLARPKFPLLRKAGRMLSARWAAFQNRCLIRELEKSGHSTKLIFASGSLMYGSSSIPFDEDSPLKPFSFAKQYYPGEIPILDVLKSNIIDVMIIRCPWLLDKGSWFEWFYTRTMQHYQAVPLFGDGNNLMEHIDIRDAARLVVNFAGDKTAGGIINMVTAGAISQMEFAKMISAISGFPVKDHMELFKNRLEKEALEAFTSNIVLSTKYPQLTAGFQYSKLEESLKRIITVRL
jgi:nucleoside-diphosphate-sugar epimerase